MFKLLLIAIATYLVYSLLLRYSNREKIKKTSDSKTAKKYSKMEISDAEFNDIDEN